MKKYKVTIKAPDGYNFVIYSYAKSLHDAFSRAASMILNDDKSIKIKEVKK